MLVLNSMCLLVCSYWVATDETWSGAWWYSGIGVVLNTIAVLFELTKG